MKALHALGIHRPCCSIFLRLNLCAEELQIRSSYDAYCRRMDELHRSRRQGGEAAGAETLECAPFAQGMGIRCASCFKTNTLKAGQFKGFNTCTFCMNSPHNVFYKRPVPGGVFWC